MRKLQSKLISATQGGSFQSAIETAEELMQVTDEEGVTPVLPEMHDILAAIYLDMRDWNNARRFGQKALEGWYKFDSVDNYQLEMAQWFVRHVELMKKLVEKQEAAEAKEEEDDDDEDDDDE
jgi:hypothetical protein